MTGSANPCRATAGFHGRRRAPGARRTPALDADRYAAVLDDIAADGLPSVEDRTPWEELPEAQLARLAAQHPAVA